jgi:hypothetical protein
MVPGSASDEDARLKQQWMKRTAWLVCPEISNALQERDRPPPWAAWIINNHIIRHRRCRNDNDGPLSLRCPIPVRLIKKFIVNVGDEQFWLAILIVRHRRHFIVTQ